MAWNKKGDGYNSTIKRRILAGLCKFCEEPHAPEHTMCYDCLEKHNRRNRSYKAKLRKENKCTRCACPLHPEMDKGHLDCLNCREGVDRF